MIFKSVVSLRKYLQRQTKKGRSLHRIQREEFRAAKVGTLSRIKNDETYEPIHPELRAALLLAPNVCPHCHHRERSNHKPPRVPSDAEFWWDHLKPAERREFKELLFGMGR